MLTNFHTHTSLCDGESSPEEVVLSAIEKGFSAIGFSGHAHTYFDLSYCLKDTEAYISTIQSLKEKYKHKIQIYLGIEEDIYSPVNRKDFDYIISSSHYSEKNGNYIAIDLDYEGYKKCLNAWGYDILGFAEGYYKNFCDYILERKPDIIGHFDLITKFDELDVPLLLNNKQYNALAEKYLQIALKSECLFEVNTGAISRGYRTAPYPSENLLYCLKRNGGKIILSSDSHSADTLDCRFEETKQLLKEIGFEYVYTLYNNEFIKDYL